MSAKAAEQQGSALDIIKLGTAVALLIGGVGAFYYLDDYSLLLRVLGLLVITVAAAGIAVTSTQGRAIWAFATDARTEVRKVVWPTRQEAVQTTLIVLVVVLIMSLFLWAIDSVLFWVVRLLTGQGG